MSDFLVEHRGECPWPDDSCRSLPTCPDDDQPSTVTAPQSCERPGLHKCAAAHGEWRHHDQDKNVEKHTHGIDCCIACFEGAASHPGAWTKGCASPPFACDEPDSTATRPSDQAGGA